MGEVSYGGGCDPGTADWGRGGVDGGFGGLGFAVLGGESAEAEFLGFGGGEEFWERGFVGGR